MFTFDAGYFPHVNIVLGVVGFVWLLLRSTQRWKEYPHEIQLLLFVTLSFIFALLEVSAEQIIYDDFVSFNSIVIFCVKSFLLVVLFKTRNTLYRTGERAAGSGDEINPDRNVSASHAEPPAAGEDQPDALPNETVIEDDTSTK